MAGSQDRISAHRGRIRNDPRDAARVRFEQRARILEAVAHRVATKGYVGIGIDPVIHIAGLSRRTVYDLFPGGTAEFVLAAHQAALDHGLAQVLAAFDQQGDWASGFCAGIHAYVRLLRCSDPWARFWVVEILGAPAAAQAVREQGCELLVERLEAAVESRAAARAMFDVVDGATRRALRAGTAVAPDELAAIALRPVASATEIRTAIATAGRARRRLRVRPVELEYEAARLPEPTARKRLEAIIAEAGAARDGLTLWRLLRALAPKDSDDATRDALRDLVVARLPSALHFGVPLADAMRLP